MQKLVLFSMLMMSGFAGAQEQAVSGWKMQAAAKVSAAGAVVSGTEFRPEGWYAATVPGTVLTTLVDNKVYPEPLYGENMRAIPESLNRNEYWFRATFPVAAAMGRRTWLHFAGVNYGAEIWVNGQKAGEMVGAFVRGDFDVTALVKPGRAAVVAVRVRPEPHPGVPHEHTQALGVGKNGGETAIDGPTFLSTIGWDWIPAIRDRDTGIWLPVTVETTGPVVVKDPVVTSRLAAGMGAADLTVGAMLDNRTAKPVTGVLVGTIIGQAGTAPLTFQQNVTVEAGGSKAVTVDAAGVPVLHMTEPKLWWPNGYGPQNLYTLKLELRVGKGVSAERETTFGIRKIEYQVADSENLTISVNGVRVMVRGGNWGLDEAMKRVPKERLEAQFHLHALANLNMIRNWVGQSTSPEFYAMADKYGMLVWDEFFQPNPNDGPDPADIPTYLANVSDKIVRYRNHPSIAVWCARNEGYPPKELDDQLKTLVARLDQTRLYQSNSADGRGVSSHGPYYWRSPRFFYQVTESFKTETGSVSVPTLESIQGMMPQKDWETINDDWAQHDMAAGAQRGNEFPQTLAKRYGHIRNLADFARKGQLATYEAFRAMYEGRNAQMFQGTSGILTWMSDPAQPSFVWQLYHYDLEPNAALYAVKKAAEPVHVQLNEANGGIEVVNNRPEALAGATLRVTTYESNSIAGRPVEIALAEVPGSSVRKVAELGVNARISPLYFVKLDLVSGDGRLLSTNFYWQNVAQDDFTAMEKMPLATVELSAISAVEGDQTVIKVTAQNASQTIAVMTHVQLHRRQSGVRVLPVFYSDNYLSLVPGEMRTVTIRLATKDLAGEAPLLLVDGWNVGVMPVEGDVSVRLNENAQPAHWPATQIVPGGI
jgi:mannosylglycoprotein endo-beta-mannosidase